MWTMWFTRSFSGFMNISVYAWELVSVFIYSCLPQERHGANCVVWMAASMFIHEDKQHCSSFSSLDRGLLFMNVLKIDPSPLPGAARSQQPSRFPESKSAPSAWKSQNRQPNQNSPVNTSLFPSSLFCFSLLVLVLHCVLSSLSLGHVIDSEGRAVFHWNVSVQWAERSDYAVWERRRTKKEAALA